MTQSLKNFMHGIIDYAGLFPPADLDLDTAVRNFAEYLQDEEAWMLSRFIVPASRLPELDPLVEELFTGDHMLSLSVLGGKTETVEEFEEQAESLADAIGGIHSRHGESVTTDILEIGLPREVVLSNDEAELKRVIDRMARLLNRSLDHPGFVFYESVLEQSWKKDLDVVTRAIAAHNEETAGELSKFRYSGFKMRCGGTEAAHFPEPEQIAFALNRARDRNLAIKCTAGLHHPVRHFREEVQTRMHGFLNVFGGAMLSWAHNLNDDEFEAVLKEEDPGQFLFTDEAFSWKEHSIFAGEIAELREVALISYGSCSFDEPREDLGSMGLL